MDQPVVFNLPVLVLANGKASFSSGMNREWVALASGYYHLNFEPLEKLTMPPDASDIVFVSPKLIPEYVTLGRVRGPAAIFWFVPKVMYDGLPDPFLILDETPFWRGKAEENYTFTIREEMLKRPVEDLQPLLEDGDIAFLLGATQILVDTGRIVTRKTTPDTVRFRKIWSLLPTPVRRELPMATLTAAPNFFALCSTPNSPLPDEPYSLDDQQAADYPESRYETNLELTIKAGDQQRLDLLFLRRTSQATMRLAIRIIAIAFGIVVALGLLTLVTR